jgi:hypothetical protein
MQYSVSLRSGALVTAAFLATTAMPAMAQSSSDATSILFIGNSFTYGEPAGGPPTVMDYKPGSVTDLNGTGIGGVPALFKQMTLDRGLNYNVFLETEPGSNLDFHFDNRLALINKPWDKVVMHGQSNLDFDHPNDPTRISTWTHNLGKVFQSQNPDVGVYLTATWSRANLTYRPACSGLSPASPWCGADITQMGIDVMKGYQVAMDQNRDIVKAIDPVGLAWNYAMTSGFADPHPYNGVIEGVNLWAPDNYHASSYGYYLHALVDFGVVTGLDPTVLGFDTVAHDLGFTSAEAMAMQGFAEQAIAAAVPEPSTVLSMLLGGGVLGFIARRRQTAKAG